MNEKEHFSRSKRKKRGENVGRKSKKRKEEEKTMKFHRKFIKLIHDGWHNEMMQRAHSSCENTKHFGIYENLILKWKGFCCFARRETAVKAGVLRVFGSAWEITKKLVESWGDAPAVRWSQDWDRDDCSWNSIGLWATVVDLRHRKVNWVPSRIVNMFRATERVRCESCSPGLNWCHFRIKAVVLRAKNYVTESVWSWPSPTSTLIRHYSLSYSAHELCLISWPNNNLYRNNQ